MSSFENEVITIDGPVSSGKNTLGFLFSRKINFQYVDAGWIYRATTYLIIQHKLSFEDKDKIVEIIKTLPIEFTEDDNQAYVWLNGIDVTNDLNTPEISQRVPSLGMIREVEDCVKDFEREYTKKHHTVMSGRDIGETFKNAKLKFYIDVPVEERAKRRFEQHKNDGHGITYEKVLEDLKVRDFKDKNREYHPMTMSSDAIIIQNVDKTPEQVVDEMYSFYQKAFSSENKRII